MALATVQNPLIPVYFPFSVNELVGTKLSVFTFKNRLAPFIFSLIRTIENCKGESLFSKADAKVYSKMFLSKLNFKKNLFSSVYRKLQAFKKWGF